MMTREEASRIAFYTAAGQVDCQTTREFFGNQSDAIPSSEWDDAKRRVLVCLLSAAQDWAELERMKKAEGLDP